MTPKNAQMIRTYVNSLGDAWRASPNTAPSGAETNPYAFLWRAIKAEFGSSYKDIPDGRCAAVVEFLDTLRVRYAASPLHDAKPLVLHKNKFAIVADCINGALVKSFFPPQVTRTSGGNTAYTSAFIKMDVDKKQVQDAFVWFNTRSKKHIAVLFHGDDGTVAMRFSIVARLESIEFDNVSATSDGPLSVTLILSCDTFKVDC